MSLDIGESFALRAMRRKAASALPRRPGSMLRQVRNEVSSRAATAGFGGVQIRDDLGDEIVTLAVGSVEDGLIAGGEAHHERVDAVRIGEGKCADAS